MAAMYSDMVASSANAYAEFLGEVIGSAATKEVVDLAGAVRRTTLRAAGGEYASDHASDALSLGMVAASGKVDPVGTSRLANEFSLGLGCPRPSIVFVGKEAAYDVRTPVNFLLESLALTALWSSTDPASQLSAILGADVKCDFLRDPASLPMGNYGDVRRKPGHNWQKVAKVMTAALGHGVTSNTWGQHAYLLELGAVPSFRHRRLAPSPARVQFLMELLRTFAASGARMMLLHSQEEHHEPAQAKLISAFLGLHETNASAAGRVVADNPRREKRVELWQHGSRRVIRCRHLSNSISKDLIATLGQLIRS